MPASKDPRSYIQPIPLPTPSCKGQKLLAAGDTINFNAEVPSREEVRQNNYCRRLNQMSMMGFRSANHKTYMGIGDPFYLDEQKMILSALGQWTDEDASTSDSDEEHESDESTSKPTLTAAKFVLRRSRRDLNTINKAVVHGRSMIQKVSLGHGLFDLINKEDQRRKELSDAAMRKQKEQLMLPPRNESDDETDDGDSDVDLMNYMVYVAPPTFLTQQQTDTDEELGIVNDNNSESDQSPESPEPDIVTFSGLAWAEDDEEYQRARSAMVTTEMSSSYSRPVSRHKKKQETQRPYTPKHAHLSANHSVMESMADSGGTYDITRDYLFRQLCVLHWIMEAMSTDPPSPMTPIMSCWSLFDVGGSRVHPKKLQRDKASENAWLTFISKDTAKATKRLSTQRLSNRSPHVRRPLHMTRRNSNQSSVAGSQQGGIAGSFKFLDEYYESLKSEEEAKGKKDIDNKSPSSTPPTSPTPQAKIKVERTSKKKKKKRKDDTEKRLDHKVAVALGEEEKMTSKYLRANAHLIRPKSSPALIEFQAALPSNKKASMCENLHNQFAECIEEKALMLHDILDHKECERMAVCQSKFVSLQGMKLGSSFHRAVKEMRTKSWQQLRKPINDGKKAAEKGNWYTELVEKIPDKLKQKWFYAKILQKLGHFGLLEGTGKQSIYKFIKILEVLRKWEICCPDITAAIEFCREHIVDMTVEEYDSWFTQRFPIITRPQTTPTPSKR